ncbi:MAG: helix-turn-helix domain-containing protein [Clostridiales bacterium]|nr:helix-turn-helix domain-containing protein [Clostridiales bacterium]
MALTIDWLLNQTSLPGFSLLVGEGPFKQTISGVNIIDNPNTVPWLSEGTLVLSTGYLLSQSELSRDIIHQLHQKNCAGFAIKMNRYLDKLSPEMIFQAEQLHFPVIGIPFSCNLEQVTNLIYRRLFDEEMDEAGKRILAYQNISDCILKEKSMTRALDIISNIFQCSVYLTTPSYEIIDYSLRDDNLYPFLSDRDTYTLFSDTDIQYLKKSYIDHPFPLNTHQVTNGSSTQDFQILSITNQGQLLGFLILAHISFRDNYSLYTFLTNLPSILSIGILNQSIYVKNNRLSNKEIFFQKLLSGEPDSVQETETLCMRNHFDYRTSRICILFSLGNYEHLPFVRQRPAEHRIMELVKPHLKKYWDNYQYTFYENQLILFLFTENRLSHTDYMTRGLETAENLSQLLTSNGFSSRAGISSDSSGAMTIHTAYQQARQALETGPKLHPENHCFSYFQDRIYHKLMNHFTYRELHEIYAEYLECLERYDLENHTELLTALQAYLLCGCNASRTAKELFIHRNTMSYRLEQIRNLLGIDLKNPEECLSLQIAFYVRTLLNQTQPKGPTEYT